MDGGDRHVTPRCSRRLEFFFCTADDEGDNSWLTRVPIRVDFSRYVLLVEIRAVQQTRRGLCGGGGRRRHGGAATVASDELPH